MAATLDQVLDAVLMLQKRIDALQAPKKPGVTVAEFCRQTGMSDTTFYRRNIRKVNGRVPNEVLQQYLS